MQTTFKLTHHAEERLTKRLNTITSVSEVMGCVAAHNLPKGRSYLEVKKIKFTEIKDPAVVPDGIARGDQIIVVIDNDNSPRITTVILRKSWSKSSTYSTIIH